MGVIISCAEFSHPDCMTHLGWLFSLEISVLRVEYLYALITIQDTINFLCRHCGSEYCHGLLAY
jgi:hypothetical protein